MTLSKIWSTFIVVGILVSSIKYFSSANDRMIFMEMVTGESGDSIIVNKNFVLDLPADKLMGLDSGKVMSYNDVFLKKMEGQIQVIRVSKSSGIITTAKTAVEISMGLIGVMALFMGIMSIAEMAGGMRFLSKIIFPFLSKFFPDVPKGHPAYGHMMMNFSANLLGLDNAATPFGLKAMESLQSLNSDTTRASNAQIMFLCMHASGLTLIPVSIIAIRASMGASNPTDVFLSCMIATFFATIAAMILVSIKQKINLFQSSIIAWILGITASLVGLVLYLKSLDTENLKQVSSLISNGLILFILFAIVLGAVYKKINVFDAFIDGAKEGFTVSIKIIPYLVGILIAISVLRTSGAFDILMDGLKYVFAFLPDTRFVDAMPTALMKPLSGSGARGMMVDTMKTFGADSFQSYLSGILQGSSDTTFYVVALYFGSIGVKNTRYSIPVMLLADLVGVLTAIFLAYLFWQ